MQEFVKIVPKAANAFKIEVYHANGNLAYVLVCHTDSSDKLHILPKTAENKATVLTLLKGHYGMDQEEMDFAALTIHPLRREIIDPKKRILYLTKKLSDIKPEILGSYLFSLRRAWLHATEGHRKQLLPAMEAAFKEHPFLEGRRSIKKKGKETK